jgi:RNA polymerase sigma-70 factor (ECF subfamily)
MKRPAFLKTVPLNPGDSPDRPKAEGVRSDAEEGVSFDDLYDRHFNFVWRCLASLGVPPVSLHDAAQDVFLVVHRQLGGFRGDATVRSWLYGIARNVASNHQRRAGRKDAVLEPLVVEPPYPGPGPHERTADAEAATFVLAFLQGLEPKKRDVFILAVLEQMTIPEVAAALSIRLNTAYGRLRAVRAELASALARHEP